MSTNNASYKTMMSTLLSIKSDFEEFIQLEKHVRSGEYPDSPTILYRYLELGDFYAKQQPKNLAINFHVRILNTLLEVICDTCITRHWRQLCLDNGYRPLSAIKKLASTDEQQQYLKYEYQRFRTLSHYFLM